ncbi:type VII secretion-associated serine protease mycosin [Streptomyces sp. SID14478]|uniref:type VII secretion-associated serine protease mycosin n=1 Tax=Streptomyces sp. SID14478 TaxID=2706073 RepID=UPI0013DBB4A7|nr:type VII secretion-associated serine protease mycosin [Streptomyces sp. SID14478]NEB76321.1 type VII secretion-associated serine protease mycosin [Streptomyces sp. SID14478]
MPSPRLLVRRAVTTFATTLVLTGAAALPAHADSIRDRQWFLDAMKAEQMWKTNTGKNITVAVIDTGVNANHPDLRGRVLPGKDLADDKPGDARTDYDGHGTGMAGLIAGTGARGATTGSFGLAPGAKILPVRLPRKDGQSQAEGDQDLAQAIPVAIRYAADAGAKIINVSQAIPASSRAMTDAVTHALDKGALVFAGVGNNGGDGNPVMYPAATPGVVAVGAVGKDLKKTEESEYGSQVDMAAPGEDMVAACGGETGVCRTHGTSDATALASASAALVWSAHPNWTNNQVLRVMLNTIGAPVDGSKRTDAIGYGIVRPRIAMTKPGDPGSADEYPLPDFPAKASAAPSASSSTGHVGEEHQAAGVKDSSSQGTTTWVAAGAGAVVVMGALAGFVVMRRRKRTAGFGQVGHSQPPYGPPSSYGPASTNPQDEHRPY